ncbi:MAG TPA: hypothetical protein V6D12_13635 [Candidatus Obscuribacterales bacterium]
MNQNESTRSQIVRREQDGVEFFTKQDTGESGMSESGLARFCGVTPKAINLLLANLAGSNEVAECLKPFLGKDNHLVAGTEYKNANIIKDEVCAAIIGYYAFEAKRKRQQAVFAFRKFANLGMRSFIQGVTGWQPTQPTDAIAPIDKQLELVKWQVELSKAKTNELKTLQQIQESSHMLVLIHGEHRLAGLRGEAPIEKVYEEKVFVDSATGEVVGSTKSRCSLSAILRAIGLDEKAIASTKIQKLAKNILRSELGIDFANGIGTESAAYVRQYNVIPEAKKADAIRVLKDSIAADESLFEYLHRDASSKLTKGI